MGRRGFCLDECGQAVKRVAPFQEASDLREFGAGDNTFDHGREEVQCLTPEKIHGAHRLEKQGGRCRHAARHDGVGNPLEQGQIFDGEGGVFRTNRKRVPETGSKILCATG